MHIQRQQLQEIERSLKECARHAEKMAKALPMDSRDRRNADTDLARATDVLVEIRRMLDG
jgi:hypothetical protein